MRASFRRVSLSSAESTDSSEKKLPWEDIFRQSSARSVQRHEHITSRAQIAREKLQEAAKKEMARLQWPCLRRRIFYVVNSHAFEICCAFVILFSLVVVVIETDYVGGDVEPPRWIDMCTYGFLLFYTLELTCKLYGSQSEFFHETWNIIDLIIVGIDVVSIVMKLLIEDLPAFRIFRIFRLLRVVRAFKAAQVSRELRSLLRSCASAIKAIFWGMVMLIMVLLVWGILAVQLIHPINQRIADKGSYEGCERCPRAFSTVFDSMLTFWKQLVAGDSWGTLSEPIIDEEKWTSLFFMLVLITVSLTMLNCILAVVVEAGCAATAADDHEKALDREEVILKAEDNLVALCHEIDHDGHGTISFQDFCTAFTENKNFRHCLELMHATEADLLMIFNICDEDGTGDIDYREFVEQLRRIKHSSQNLLLHYVTDIRQKMMRIKPEFLVDPARSSITSQKSSFSQETDAEQHDVEDDKKLLSGAGDKLPQYVPDGSKGNKRDKEILVVADEGSRWVFDSNFSTILQGSKMTRMYGDFYSPRGGAAVALTTPRSPAAIHSLAQLQADLSDTELGSYRSEVSTQAPPANGSRNPNDKMPESFAAVTELQREYLWASKGVVATPPTTPRSPPSSPHDAEDSQSNGSNRNEEFSFTAPDPDKGNSIEPLSPLV